MGETVAINCRDKEVRSECRLPATACQGCVRTETREEASDRRSLTARGLAALFAELAQERLTRFIFTRRDPRLAVLDHASNRRGGDYLVAYHHRDGPVHMRSRKILKPLGRLGRKVDHQPTAVRVPVNLRFALDYERCEIRRVEHNVFAFVLPDHKTLPLRATFLDGIDAVGERSILGHQSAD